MTAPSPAQGSLARAELDAVFARPPKGDPLRPAEAGLFLATPLDVLVAACAALLQDCRS